MSISYDNTSAIRCQDDILRSANTLSKQTQRKHLALRVSDILARAGYGDAARAIEGCGDTIIMREYSDGAREVAGAMYCRQRLCPICQWRRSLKLYGQLSACMDALDEGRIKAGKKPYRYLLLSVTIINCPNDALSEAITRMQDGFRAMTRSPEWQRSVLGAFRSTEIKRSERPEPQYRWHPHIHAILCVQPSYFTGAKYLSKDAWIKLWKRCARLPYDPSIDIQAVAQADIVNDGEKSRQGAQAEATKYVCKADWYTLSEEEAVADASVLMDILKNRRLVGWYGNLRQMHRALHLDGEDGDLVDIAPIRADVAYTLTHYIWQDGVYMRIPMRAAASTLDLYALANALVKTNEGKYIPEDDDYDLLHDVLREIHPHGQANPFHEPIPPVIPHI